MRLEIERRGIYIKERLVNRDYFEIADYFDTF